MIKKALFFRNPLSTTHEVPNVEAVEEGSVIAEQEGEGMSPAVIEQEAGDGTNEYGQLAIDAFLSCLNNVGKGVPEGVTIEGASATRYGGDAQDTYIRSLFPGMWGRGYGNVSTGLAALGWRGDITSLEGWSNACPTWLKGRAFLARQSFKRCLLNHDSKVPHHKG